MTGKPITAALTQVGALTGHPLAFLVFAAYAASWLIFEPETFDFHGGATLVTWLMTLFIQRAEHRDTQAVQAKLDELLRAHGDARTELTRLDKKTASEIEEHRAQAQAQDGP